MINARSSLDLFNSIKLFSGFIINLSPTKKDFNQPVMIMHQIERISIIEEKFDLAKKIR